jgi:hypothetical protein
LCCVVAGATEPLSLGGQVAHEQQTNVNELTAFIHRSTTVPHINITIV